MQGAYTVPLPPDELRARARAVQLACSGAVICGRTAARLHRLPGLGGSAIGRDEPIFVLLPTDRPRARRRGALMHWGDLGPGERVRSGDIVLTAVMRTLVDLVVWSDRLEVVSLLDAVLHSGRLRQADLGRLRATVLARAGGAAASRHFGLVDGRAESPLESRTRLLLVDAGLPPEGIQYPVRGGDGQILARLDFAWPSRRIAVEVDGSGPHSEPAALFRDRARQNLLMELRWIVLRFTWRDIVYQPVYVIDTIRANLRPAASSF